MKICIIGFPRSRSSVLIETISLFYNIPIIGEDINDHRNFMENFLIEISNFDNGIIRFHPTHLMSYPEILEDYPKLINLELLKFEQYDKIFFSYRNVSGYVSSLVIAEQLGKYTYQSVNDLETDIPTMCFSPAPQSNHKLILKDYINSELIVKDIKEHLKRLNIPSIDLYYEDVPDYLMNNFPNTKSFHIETNYDYKGIFTNYSEIEVFYNKLKPEVIKKYQHHNG